MPFNLQLKLRLSQWTFVKNKYTTSHKTKTHGAREKLKAPAAAFFTTLTQNAGINCYLFRGSGDNRFNKTERSNCKYWTGTYYCKHCNNKFNLCIDHEPKQNFSIKLEYFEFGCLEKMTNISCSSNLLNIKLFFKKSFKSFFFVCFLGNDKPRMANKIARDGISNTKTNNLIQNNVDPDRGNLF